VSNDKRRAHEDNRHEAAAAARLAEVLAHEEGVRRSEQRRMWVRMDPIFSNPRPVEDLPDFPGCFW
jgi:hypothetical protein